MQINLWRVYLKNAGIYFVTRMIAASREIAQLNMRAGGDYSCGNVSQII